jgi:hypothetical protein
MESIGVEGLYPSSLRESASSLIGFIEQYYNYLNSVGLPSNEIANITRDKDIDIVSNKYLTEIQSLIARNIPNSRAVDKVTLYRIIIQYYRTRGSEDSIHTFFKLFFDEIVDIFYPRNYLFDLSGGSGKWAPLDIPSLSEVYTNPNKATLEIISDYKIGPFPFSAKAPYAIILQAISKNVWTYNGITKEVNLPYVERVNISSQGQPPVFRWLYKYGNEFELYSTNDTTWPDEAQWQTISRNIENSTIGTGISLLESQSFSFLENNTLALLENAQENEVVTTKNIQHDTVEIIPILPTFEPELVLDESITGQNFIDESILANEIVSERIIILGDDDIDISLYGLTTEEEEYLLIERGGEPNINALAVEGGSRDEKFITIFDSKNIEYYHLFSIEAFPRYTTKIGDLVHSLEDVIDPTINAQFLQSKVYRSTDLDPILWVEIDKNIDVWSYADNKSFASDLYKLHDGEYWQKYSYRIRSMLPQEDWVNDYLRFVHPAGLKLFSAILYEFVSRTAWNNTIDYIAKRPQDSYLWLNAYEPPVVGYHTPRYQPGWLTGNERLLTIILEYLKSSGSEDDFIRLIRLIIKIFTQSTNPRNKNIHTEYQRWLKYLDPNELIAGYADKTIDEANSPWTDTSRALFSNISSFISFKFKDPSYYPWFYSELIPLDPSYEDTDDNYNEATISSFDIEMTPYNNSTLEDREPLVYGYVLEAQNDDDFITENSSGRFITEGQQDIKTVISLLSNKSTVKENETVRFYALTKNIPEGTTLYWSVSQPNIYPQSGTTIVKNEVAVFKALPLINFTTGASQTFTATLRQGGPEGQVLVNSLPVTVNNNIEIPTYSITSNTNSIAEGQEVTFTVTSTNVDDYETIYYVATLANDVTPISGSVVIKNNTASFTITASPDDLNSEGSEYFNVKLYACGFAGLSVATSENIEISDGYKIWEFTAQSSQLSGFSISTVPASQILIRWDNDLLNNQIVNSGESVSHTYS